VAAAHAEMLKIHAETKARKLAAKLEAKREQRVTELKLAQEQLDQLRACAEFVSTSKIIWVSKPADDDADEVATAQVSMATKRKLFERWEKPKRRLYLFDYQVHAFRYARMKRSVRRQLIANRIPNVGWDPSSVVILTILIDRIWISG
jgi:hypothetical protein